MKPIKNDNASSLAMTLVMLAWPVFAQAAAPVLNAPADVAAIQALEQKNAAQLDGHELAKTYAANAVMLDYMVPGLCNGRRGIEAAFTKELAAKSQSGRLQDKSRRYRLIQGCTLLRRATS